MYVGAMVLMILKVSNANVLSLPRCKVGKLALFKSSSYKRFIAVKNNFSSEGLRAVEDPLGPR